MISLKIAEVKPFMAKLLTNNVFDTFLLRELDIQTFTNFHITGQLNETFFSEEELKARNGTKFILWSEVRGIALAMIRGNKTPLSFKVVFQLAEEASQRMLQDLSGKLRPEDVGGLYMNIRFEKGELYMVTGTAIKTFTLDKTLEQEWDTQVRRFLMEHEIIYEEA